MNQKAHGDQPGSRSVPTQLTQTFEGLPGIRIIADDILVCGEGDKNEAAEKDHDTKQKQLL